jgi:hypothetical protein
MGYSTVGYGVDLDRLMRASGSRDETLLIEIQERFSEQLAHAQQMNANLYHLSVELPHSLRMLIEGDYSDSSHGAAVQRLYAYELLCKYFGRYLDGQEHINFLDDLRWETALTDFRTPLGLASTGEFPFTSYLTSAETKLEYERFESVGTETEDSWITEGREEFVWWLKQCADTSQALVVFTY